MDFWNCSLAFVCNSALLNLCVFCMFLAWVYCISLVLRVFISLLFLFVGFVSLSVHVFFPHFRKINIVGQLFLFVWTFMWQKYEDGFSPGFDVLVYSEWRVIIIRVLCVMWQWESVGIRCETISSVLGHIYIILLYSHTHSWHVSLFTNHDTNQGVQSATLYETWRDNGCKTPLKNCSYCVSGRW